MGHRWAKCPKVVARLRHGPLYIVVRCALEAGHPGACQKVKVVA